MMNTYSSAQFAKLAGVSVITLQRWDREGRLKPAARTPGNRRLYTPEQLNQMLNRVSKTKLGTIATLRISSQSQKPVSIRVDFIWISVFPDDMAALLRTYFS